MRWYGRLWGMESNDRTAIIVDSALYASSKLVRQWIDTRISNDCKLIMLVSDPVHANYDSEIFPENFEADVLITNTGALRDYDFKLKALQSIQNLSNFHIAVALDPDWTVCDALEAHGVPVAMKFPRY